jgi:hypothetical protein
MVGVRVATLSFLLFFLEVSFLYTFYLQIFTSFPMLFSGVRLHVTHTTMLHFPSIFTFFSLSLTFL